MCRETYLIKATQALQAHVFGPAGYEVPSDVHVSCSWPGGGSKAKRIGECWPRGASDAEVNEVFISPSIADSERCLDILTHELIHAIDDCQHGHRKEFTKIMRAVGLEGKPTATHAGDELKAKLQEIIGKIGEYPHKELKFNKVHKKQTTRMIKLSCMECEAVWRMSRTVAERVEMCPCCGASIDRIDIG